MSEQRPILLIDDDPAWTATLAEYLHDHGLAAEATTDAAAGLDLLAGRPFALAVVDYHLPGTDGLAVLRQLRGRGLPTPVIVVSGDDDPTLPARAAAAGASAFVAKTSSPRFLLRAVRQALAPPRAADARPWQHLLPGPRPGGRGTPLPSRSA